MQSHQLAYREIVTWQQELAHLICKPEDLLNIVGLSKQRWLANAERATKLFPLRATHSYVGRIQPGNPHDPLLLQILPLHEELSHTDGYEADPLKEQTFIKAPGLIHKYVGRVLLVAAPQCAINCRYCFRRHFDYTANAPSRQQWQQALGYIATDPSIEEVILSGGDPLVLSDRQLQWLIRALENIAHLKRLRIHSRLPIVLPQRMSSKLVNLLKNSRLKTVVVVHCNHPQEIDSQVSSTLLNLRQAGLTVLNQSVLLKNINDNSQTLAALSTKLFQCGALPYYLHQMDKVSGTAHFEVIETAAKKLHTSLQRMLPGYLVPKLVREIAGMPHKTLLNW